MGVHQTHNAHVLEEAVVDRAMSLPVEIALMDKEAGVDR